MLTAGLQCNRIRLSELFRKSTGSICAMEEIDPERREGEKLRLEISRRMDIYNI